MRYSNDQRARMTVPAISKKHGRYEVERIGEIKPAERLVLELAEKNIEIFRLEDARRILQADGPTTSRVLRYLAGKRRVERIERGKYMFIPEHAGTDLRWTVDAIQVVPHLMDDCYMGFCSAMSYWDMTDQIPYTVFVVSTKMKRGFDFGYMRYRFVKLSKKKFFGSVELKYKKGTFRISSREKTIVDGLMHPEYCGMMPEVSKAMWNVRDDVDWEDVLDMARKTGINVVLKRLGYMLSTLEIEDGITGKIKRLIKRYPYQHFDNLGRHVEHLCSKEYGLMLNYTQRDLLRWMEF
ncbi:transcriptional regulator [Cenarchaeum symbiosum A]|uniref:Transcriptional regulator n=1 Tax=Cenarchaeum symbiosum (strain A) TaxID=414004 RepID=A0RWG0_CENSY|nr:transcriptional regulator [Cenarchaeum symbiosum A]